MSPAREPGPGSQPKINLTAAPGATGELRSDRAFSELKSRGATLTALVVALAFSSAVRRSIRRPRRTPATDQGQVQLREGQVQLREGQVQLPEGQVQLPEGQVQLPEVGLPEGEPTASAVPDGPEEPTGPRFPWTLKRRRLVMITLLVAIVSGGGIWMSSRFAPVLYLGYVGISLVLGVIAATTLAWTLDAWHTPDSFTSSRAAGDDLEPTHSFSLIVPARHEEAVLEITLSRLLRSDHPAFEVLVVIGDDDDGTREVADRMAERHPGLVRVVVDDSQPKSKPKALNAALPHCRCSIIGVFDAEDVVHGELLRRVDQCFQKTDADVVQAGVQLMNFRSSWLTVRNVLEYYFWFRSRLHLHARQRFIPLGGNTVFIRTQVLRAVDGWDPECLAEDCELGVRLSSLGARTAVFYEPELVTREECPPTLRAFVRQRTRWNQGYLQTLSKGYWRRLPLPQRALGAYILAMPYVMAIAWLLIPVAIVTAFVVKAPVGITLISFLPALPMLSMLVVEVAALGEFCREYEQPASARDYVRLVAGLPLYQAALTFAAARAVVREARGARGWEKTAHLGLHLAPGDDEEEARSPSQPAVRAWPGLGDPEARSVSGPLRGALRAAAMPAVVNSRATARSSADRESAATGGLPLWLRLDAVTPGSTSLSLPGFRLLNFGWAGLSWRGGVRDLSRIASSHIDLLLQLVLLGLVATVVGTNILHWPDPQFDEGTYVANAWALHHGALAPYTYSYGHPPLGWLVIFLWTSVTGMFGHAVFSVDGSRELMLAVNLVSCALLYTLARRLEFSRAAAAAAVILFGLSPLALFYHRAVLLDNPATAWALAAFVLARTRERRLWAFAASGACFAASVLSKETSLILLPALVWAAAQNVDPRTRRYCLTLLASFFLVIALSYPLYATLKGELLPGHGHVSLIGYMVVQLFTRASTGSLFNPHSQTHVIVSSWLHLDPWLLTVALVLSPIAFARRTTRSVALAFLIQVAMILRPGYLPNMYVVGLLPFAALIVSGSIESVWRARLVASGRLARRLAVVIGGAVLAVAIMGAESWAHGDGMATTTRLDGPTRAAERWLAGHIARDKRLIVTDELWIYLIEHGFDAHAVRGGFYSRTVVSYWPLDYDPAVKRHFPRGWRDFDYVVVNQDMRVTMTNTPTAAKAVAHSRAVASFGHGSQLIQVRAITGTGR